MYRAMDLTYRAIEPLKLDYPKQKPVVPKEVYEARKARLMERLAKEGIDAVVIYADREHLPTSSITPAWIRALKSRCW